MQVVVLIAGLVWSGLAAQRIGANQDASSQAWPMMVFSFGVTLVLLWLLVA
jgi:hypothetical protein